jgi:acyl carrier protein
MAMEEAFDIEIADEVAEKITAVKDAIEHVNKVAG